MFAVFCLYGQLVKPSSCCDRIQEPARPHFSFLSPVSSCFCSSQLQVLGLKQSFCFLRFNQVLFLLGFEYFPHAFFYLFSVSFNLLSQTHWLLGSGRWHCELSTGRELPRSSGSSQSFACHPPPPSSLLSTSIPAELTHHPALFRGNLRVLGKGGASSKSPLRQTKRSGVVFTGQHFQQSRAL